VEEWRDIPLPGSLLFPLDLDGEMESAAVLFIWAAPIFYCTHTHTHLYLVYKNKKHFVKFTISLGCEPRISSFSLKYEDRVCCNEYF